MFAFAVSSGAHAERGRKISARYEKNREKNCNCSNQKQLSRPTRRCFRLLLPRDTRCNRRSRERGGGKVSTGDCHLSHRLFLSLSPSSFFQSDDLAAYGSRGVRLRWYLRIIYLPVSLSPLTFFVCANEIIRNIAMHLSFCSRPLCGLIHPLFAFFDRLFVPN